MKKPLSRGDGAIVSRDMPRRIPSTVDQIMVEERAAAFTKRSIKTSAKLEGLKLAISMMDLTTLEGKDTPGKWPGAERDDLPHAGRSDRAS